MSLLVKPVYDLDRRVVPVGYEIHLEPKPVNFAPPSRPSTPDTAAAVSITSPAESFVDGEVRMFLAVGDQPLQCLSVHAFELVVARVSFALGGVFTPANPPISGANRVSGGSAAALGGSAAASGGGSRSPSTGADATLPSSSPYLLSAVASFHVNTLRETIDVDLGVEAAPFSSIVLEFKYVAKIHGPCERTVGMFHSDPDEWRALATQLEPTHARRLFPCFDDATFKAVYRISVTHSSKLTCLSNMPVREVRVSQIPDVNEQSVGGGGDAPTSTAAPPSTATMGLPQGNGSFHSVSGGSSGGDGGGQSNAVNTSTTPSPSSTFPRSHPVTCGQPLLSTGGCCPIEGSGDGPTITTTTTSAPNSSQPAAAQQSSLPTFRDPASHPPLSAWPQPTSSTTVAPRSINTCTAQPPTTTTYFEDTPRLPPYLVAIVIGVYHMQEAITKKGITARVYISQREPISNALFTLDLLQQAIDFFEEYFSYDLPMTKLDIVALPHFSSLAMENWGLMTFVHDFCVVSPTTPFEVRRRICRLVGHEVSHMWFGNLVSLASWRLIWLKEGLARYLEYVFVTSRYAQWSYWTNFLTDVFHASMLQDGEANTTHPVELATVPPPRKVFDYFDVISYGKGASIVRMIAAYVGEATFCAGLKHYVAKHAFGCATSEDFYASIAHAQQSAAGGTNVSHHSASSTGRGAAPSASASGVGGTAFLASALAGLNPTPAGAQPVVAAAPLTASTLPARTTSIQRPLGTVASIMAHWVRRPGHAYLYASLDPVRGVLTISQRPMTSLRSGFLAALLKGDDDTISAAAARTATTTTTTLPAARGDDVKWNLIPRRSPRLAVAAPSTSGETATPPPPAVNPLIAVPIAANGPAGGTATAQPHRSAHRARHLQRPTSPLLPPEMFCGQPPQPHVVGDATAAVTEPFLLPLKVQELARDQSSLSRQLFLCDHVTELPHVGHAVLLNTSSSAYARVDYDTPLWLEVLENYKTLATTDRVSVLLTLFEMRPFFVGSTAATDPVDRCVLLLRALYEVGDRKENHFAIWNYLSDRLEQLADLTHVYPCWEELRLLIAYTCRHLVSSGIVAFHRAPPEASTDFKRGGLTEKPIAVLLRTLCFARDMQLVQEGVNMFLWVMQTWTDPAPPLSHAAGLAMPPGANLPPAGSPALAAADAATASGSNLVGGGGPFFYALLSPPHESVRGRGGDGIGAGGSNALGLPGISGVGVAADSTAAMGGVTASGGAGSDATGALPFATSCDLDHVSLAIVAAAFQTALQHSYDFREFWAVASVLCSVAALPMPNLVAFPEAANALGGTDVFFRIDTNVVVKEAEKATWICLLLSSLASFSQTAAIGLQIHLLQSFSWVGSDVCRSVFRNSKLFPKLVETLGPKAPLLGELVNFALSNCANDMFIEQLQALLVNNSRLVSLLHRNRVWADFVTGHYSWYASTVLFKLEGVLPPDEQQQSAQGGSSTSLMHLGGAGGHNGGTSSTLNLDTPPPTGVSPDSARMCSV